MLKETKIKSIRHPEVLTEGSTPTRHPEAFATGSIHPRHPELVSGSQSGRSMVEMLGVLAVMGVLSVGGVAMYTSAMNKHRANELLNEASKRAAVVAMQMASGRGANIDEFNVNGTQAFTVSGNAGDTTFTLSVASVDDAVCRQVVNSAGTTGMIRKITSAGTDTAGDASKCTSGALVLTYNADLSNTDIPSGTIVACSGHGYKNSSDDCVCDPGYSDTDCTTAACTTGTYCGSGATKECCATDEVCTSSGDVVGTCVKNSSGCTTNASCNDPTKYCKLTGTWQNDCAEITGGTCETLDAGTSITYTHDGKTVELLSGGTMSWWAADNWCKAHGRKLVKASTLGCPVKPTSASCPSSVYSDMRNAGLSYYYWLAEGYNSCYAWYVDVSNAYINYPSTRYRDDYYYALCE